MKKRTKVILGIVLILIVGIALVAIWQRNNIEAVLMRTKYSSKELTTQIEKQDEVIAQAIDKLPGSFHVLTKEQEDALKNGKITEQEAIDIMTGKAGASNTTDSNVSASTPKGDSNTTTSANTPTANADETKSEQEKQIDQLVAQIYVLRSSFMSKLESLMQSAKNDYDASTETDKTKVKKQILMKYAGEASSLESQCDSEINKILSKLEPLLKETGGDVSVVDDIRNAYYNEKSLKKAYYIGLYT